MIKNNFILLLFALGVFVSCTNKETKDNKEQDTAKTANTIWTKEQANQWYDKHQWLVGANFNPSTSINQLEFWQADSFDPETIDKELGWAEDIGMNSMRVYLHDIVHRDDEQGLYKRIEQYLDIAEKHNISTLFVFFDSCWDPFPKEGKQRAPKPHVHNSGWMQSPGQKALLDASQYGRLEQYVRGTIAHFKDDKRILGWDIWNEPDNMTGSSYEAVEIENKVDLVYPLLEKAFNWAREENPSQPLTSGIWLGDWVTHEGLLPIQKLQIDQSDIISFHCYDGPEIFETKAKQLQRYEKPLLCTEYMARPNGSTFEDILPIGKKYNIAMYNWGLVDGKTQTKYPWNSWTQTYTDQPDVWFHEVFQNDGTPYKQKEVDLIKELTNR